MAACGIVARDIGDVDDICERRHLQANSPPYGVIRNPTVTDNRKAPSGRELSRSD